VSREIRELPPGLSIRPATRDDLATVVALRLALLDEHRENPIYNRQRADAPVRARRLFGAQLESAHETTFLAERERTAVGILRCVSSQGSPLLEPQGYCYVSSVYVLPDARRRGVLTALLARAVTWARERGFTEIRLHSVAGHEGSNAAWDAAGFEIVEYLRVKRVAPAS
jgi:GNAT superfamily N-acetyltransferase